MYKVYAPATLQLSSSPHPELNLLQFVFVLMRALSPIKGVQDPENSQKALRTFVFSSPLLFPDGAAKTMSPPA